MIFEMCDTLRERVVAINDTVLEKLDKINEEHEMGNALKATVTSTTQMSFTPVNAETFGIWCDQYMALINQEKEAKKTQFDDKPTGK